MGLGGKAYRFGRWFRAWLTNSFPCARLFSIPSAPIFYFFYIVQAVQVGSIVEEKIIIERSNVSQYISSSTFALTGIAFANADLVANAVTLYADGVDTNCSVTVTDASRTSLVLSLESDLLLSDCSFIAGSVIGISVGLLDESSSSLLVGRL